MKKRIGKLLAALAAGVLLCVMPLAAQPAYAGVEAAATGESKITIVIGCKQDEVAEGFADYLNSDDGIEGCDADVSYGKDVAVVLSYARSGNTVGGVQQILSEKLLTYVNGSEDATEEAIGDDLLVKLLTPALGQYEISEYSAAYEVYNEMAKSTGGLRSRETFYALWQKPISYIKLDLEAPAYGTEVTVDGDNQSPVPTVTAVVADASYENDEVPGDLIKIYETYWAKEKTNSSDNLYEGKLNGNALAGIQINTTFGYFMDIDRDDDVAGIYVNNELVPDEDYYYTDSSTSRGFWYQMTSTNVTVDLGSGHEDLAAKWAEYLEGENSDIRNFGAKASGSTVKIALANRDRTLDSAQTDLADSLAECIGMTGDNYYYIDNEEVLYNFVLGLSPADGYTSTDEILDELVKNGKVTLGNKQKLYAIWFSEPVSSVSFAVEPLVSGTEAGSPTINVTEGAAHWSGSLDFWFDGTGREFSGTFEEGAEYTTILEMIPDYGCYFAQDMEQNITGGEIIGTENDPYTSYAEIICTATASDTPAAATAKGDKVVSAGSTYKVLTVASGSTQGTVALIKAANKKNVSVPAAVTINGAKYAVTRVNAKAFTGKKIRKVTLGANVKKLSANAFRSSKATKIVVKTKKLTKSSVKGALKSSKVKTVKVKTGNSKTNRKYVKKYRKIFTKKNSGRSVSVKG